MSTRTAAPPLEAEILYAAPALVPDPETFELAECELEAAVLESCAGKEEWPARIAAGIRAALEFAAANPEAARTLTVDSRAGEPGETDAYVEMIGRFASMLGAGAPRIGRLPASSDTAVVSAIASIVSSHARADRLERLRDGDPDLVFLALLPYVGFSEAIRWSRAPLAA
jgi:hypothetical protein